MGQQQNQDDLDAMLANFRARCDPTDPEQAAMLAAMEEHTRRLHQARGDWERPNNRRNWNSPAIGGRAQPPAAIESLREYKKHVAAERQRQQLQWPKQQPQQQHQELLLEGNPTACSAAPTGGDAGGTLAYLQAGAAPADERGMLGSQL